MRALFSLSIRVENICIKDQTQRGLFSPSLFGWSAFGVGDARRWVAPSHPGPEPQGRRGSCLIPLLPVYHSNISASEPLWARCAENQAWILTNCEVAIPFVPRDYFKPMSSLSSGLFSYSLCGWCFFSVVEVSRLEERLPLKARKLFTIQTPEN